MGDEFEGWLEGELDRALSGRTPAGPTSRQLAGIVARGSRRRRFVTAKAAVVAAAAVVITAGAALAAGTAATGTPNPAEWGKQVQSHVQSCKAALKPGEHGIGACVSAFARQHGAQERALHSHGHGNGNGHGHGQGAAGSQTSPEPAESPEPTDSPEPTESPGT